MISLNSGNTAPDPETAKQAIDAGKADGSLWNKSDEERTALYQAAFPGPVPRIGATLRTDASTPGPPVPTTPAAPPAPWPPTPDEFRRKDAPTLQREAEEELARRRQRMGTTNTPILIQDDTGRIRKAPGPNEHPPVVATPEILPALTLPPDIPVDDPLVHAARTMAFHGELPPELLQRAVTATVDLLQHDEPTQEALDSAGDAAVAQAQTLHRADWTQWRENLDRGLTIAERDPHLRELLEDPRTWNSLELAEVLAQLGARARTYYRKRFGTKRVA